VTLSGEQQVPNEWRPLVDDLRAPPGLSVAKKIEVYRMLEFSRNTLNWKDKDMSGIDFDHLVIEAALRDCFGYEIPDNTVMLDKRGKVNPKKTSKTKEKVLEKWGTSKFAALGKAPPSVFLIRRTGLRKGPSSHMFSH
jgi:hypothetical protein